MSFKACDNCGTYLKYGSAFIADTNNTLHFLKCPKESCNFSHPLTEEEFPYLTKEERLLYEGLSPEDYSFFKGMNELLFNIKIQCTYDDVKEFFSKKDASFEEIVSFKNKADISLSSSMLLASVLYRFNNGLIMFTLNGNILQFTLY